MGKSIKYIYFIGKVSKKKQLINFKRNKHIFKVYKIKYVIMRL